MTCTHRIAPQSIALRRAALAAACATLWSTAQAAGVPGPAFPVFDTAAQVKALCDSGLADARARLKALEQRAPDASWPAAADDLYANFEDAAGPIYLISNVHPKPEVRSAAEACEQRWQDFSSSLAQNTALYRAAKAVRPADPIDAEFLKRQIEAADDAGVGLPPKQRARAKQISDRISALSQLFDRRIRDANVKLPFTEAELAGVPPGVWQKAPRDKQGRVLLGLDYPTYVPVITYADSAVARERMWRAKQNEGGDANLRTLDEIVNLRREYAALFGAPSYADFTLRRTMAGTLVSAESFLGDVKAAVEDRERKDVEDMRAAKARDAGRPVADTPFHRWDSAYYGEKLLRERHAIDQEAFRPYFPPQASLQFTMRLVEKLMGVKYTRVEGLTLWHPDVQAYTVSDAASGNPIAALYVDLYPREGKYGHAAVWSFRSGATRLDRVPQAALVVNFDRNGLTLEELETLLHEFGHSVHSNLSATRHASAAGTSVLQDFVEAPSQMLEDWVYDANVLKLFQEVCPECKPVPADLLAKANAARSHGKGLMVARQHLYASYDLALHGPKTSKAMPLWAAMEGATPLGHVQGTRFPAGFAHIAGGYAAGYYGYLWSLVVATDLRTAFAADRLDPKVGARYRSIVLANGGQRPPQELVREFMGRDFNSKAFFDELKR